MATSAQARMFADQMAQRFNFRIHDKEKSVAMIAAAGILAPIPGTPNPKSFLEDFSTTIPDPEDVLASPLGPFSSVYLAKDARSTPEGIILTIGHEAHHAERQQAGWPESTWFYAVDENSRAEEEVQACVTGESISRRVTGRKRTYEEVLASLAKSYHLGPESQNTAQQLLRGAWTCLDEGLVPPTLVAIHAHQVLTGLGL